MTVALSAWVVASSSIAASAAPLHPPHTTVDLAAPHHHELRAVARPLRDLVPSTVAPARIRAVPASLGTASPSADAAALLHGPPRYARLRVLRL